MTGFGLFVWAVPPGPPATGNGIFVSTAQRDRLVPLERSYRVPEADLGMGLVLAEL